MKKYLLLIGFTFIFGSLFSQVNAVAVDDTVYVKMGETITFNPLVNDYDPEGDEFGIQIVNSSNVDILSFTDSTITFKVPGYFTPNINLRIYYYLDLANSYPENKGSVNILLDICIVDTLQINQISAAIFPYNTQFYDHYFGTISSLYNYPKESMSSTIFQSSLWIGGKDDGLLHFSGDVSGHYGSDFWTGPLDANGESDFENAGAWFRTWKVSKEEINYHINHYNDVGYDMAEAIKNWPAHGNPELNQSEYIGPFVDVDLDGSYQPENGDYPLIKGDVSIFFVYNDQQYHYDSYGTPLGVEIHCMAWAYKGAEITDPLNNTIFYSYKIFNKSIKTYYDTYLGVYTDLDLGFYNDDFIACDVENGNFYAYNGDDFDDDFILNYDTISFGYHENIPVQGVCILGGPFMDEDSEDNPLGDCNESINGVGFGDGLLDNERFGMSRFYSYINQGGMFPPPFGNSERYELMQGYIPNGGSTGGGEDPWRFMFPGDTDPCNWGGISPSFDTLYTEETTGNPPGDRRGLASMGPFTFEAGSVHYLDIALVTAPGDQETPSKDLLQEYIAQIKQDYLLNPDEFGNQYLSIPEETKIAQQLLVYPNPTDGDIIRFELHNEQEAEYFIYNATGQMIENGSLAVKKEHSLNIGHLKAGWYILEVRVGGQVLRSKLIL
ncbi:MAG: T9SS type A sorting domain-containing protein [Bacteroidales bacterium]|nr:T9SS type A sorting domain-containing protein [Bacteroidales bacterium]